MHVDIGIGLAFAAMLCWGFGDFLIQKSTRAVGDWEALFIIGFIGAVIVFPFVVNRLPAVLETSGQGMIIIGIACVVLFFAAIMDFEALRVGKLAVVEPIWSMEIPSSAILAFFILGERVGPGQMVVIFFLMLGLFAVSIKEKQKIKKFFVERGAFLAFFAAVFMGGANFFVGWGSRVTDPLTVNFITDIFIVVVSGAHLFFTGRLGKMLRDFRSHLALLLPMGIADKAAWIAFAFAMILAPIAIAVALSESYIIVAIILGLAVNKEKLEWHQKFGFGLAVVSVITLAVMTA